MLLDCVISILKSRHACLAAGGIDMLCDGEMQFLKSTSWTCPEDSKQTDQSLRKVNHDFISGDRDSNNMEQQYCTYDYHLIG